MGRVSTCQKNCNTIDLRGAQVKKAMKVDSKVVFIMSNGLFFNWKY